MFDELCSGNCYTLPYLSCLLLNALFNGASITLLVIPSPKNMSFGLSSYNFKLETREHWIQRITFAAETNAACSRQTHSDADVAWPGGCIG